MLEKVGFELGEKKYVCISVRSTNGKPFDVTSAKYVLRNGEQEENLGTCEIMQNAEKRYRNPLICTDPTDDQRWIIHAGIYI